MLRQKGAWQSRCKVCDVLLNSKDQQTSHCRSERHQRKVRLWKESQGDSTAAAAAAAVGAQSEPAAALSATTGEEDGGKPFWCAVCEKQLTSNEQLKSHEEGKAHRKKLEQRNAPTTAVAGRAGGGEAPSAPVSLGNSVASAFTASAGGLLKCDVCNIVASSMEHLQAHYAGKSHKKSVSLAGADSGDLGEFYCTACKAPNNSQEGFDAHCRGKRHLKNAERAASGGGDGLFCKVCELSCNSEASFKAHCEGKAHVKKCRETGAPLPASQRVRTRARSHPPLVLTANGRRIPVEKLLATELRDYQLELYRQAMQHNRVLYLPTGMGKTKLGTCVLSHMLQLNPTYQVVFLVDRVLLVVQQANVIREELAAVKLPGDRHVRVAALSGSSSNLERDMASGSERDHDIIVATAGCYQNHLLQKVLFWRDVACLVIDEVHHCGKKHPFHTILKEHYHPVNSHKPRLVGLTASPAGNLDVASTIKQLNALLSRMEAKLGTVVEPKSRRSYDQFLRRAEMRCSVVAGDSQHIDESQLAAATARREDEQRAGAQRTETPCAASAHDDDDDKFQRMLASIEQYLEEALRCHSGCRTCGSDMADLSRVLSGQGVDVRAAMMTVLSLTSRRLSNTPGCARPLQHFQSVAKSWLDLRDHGQARELKKLSDANTDYGFGKVFPDKLKSQAFINDYLEDVDVIIATRLSELSVLEDTDYDEDDDFLSSCGDEDDDDYDYDDDDYDDGILSISSEPDSMSDVQSEDFDVGGDDYGLDAKQRILDKVIAEVLQLQWNAPAQDRPIALVLVAMRKDAREMVELLNEHPKLLSKNIRALSIIGQGNTPQTSGMTVKMQTEAMEALRQGRAHIAVCTSVAEEGVDLPSCSLVVQTKLPHTLTSLVQSWGRARHHGATFFVICRDLVEKEKVTRLLDREKNMEKAAQELIAQGEVV